MLAKTKLIFALWALTLPLLVLTSTTANGSDEKVKVVDLTSERDEGMRESRLARTGIRWAERPTDDQSG